MEHQNRNGVEASSVKSQNINPNLHEIREDTLYHIGLTSGKQDLKKMFGDVKVITGSQGLICSINDYYSN